MFDLHTHTFFSDGQLGPAELIRRASVVGYEGMAVCDHVDFSNVAPALERLHALLEAGADYWGVAVVPGVELTHCPAASIGKLVTRARELGAKLVLVHGETIVEPVEPGTNRAAIEAGVDVLAHPGLVDIDDARLAAERGVYLEVTAKRGHSLTNGHVVNTARRVGARMVFGSDSHAPDDLPDIGHCRRVLAGAGLNEDEIDEVLTRTRETILTRTGGD